LQDLSKWRIAPSARLFRKRVERRTFVWLVSDAIVDEYEDVLRRLGVKRGTFGRVANRLAEAAELVAAQPGAALSPDPGDESFCSCAEAGDADFLVTLNPKDFPQARPSAKVIAPVDPLPGAGARPSPRRRRRPT
jgi:predicted nucleic acid-binding protein